MSMKTTFGYLCVSRNPPEWQRPWVAQHAKTLDVIADTDRLGLGGAWLPEHCLAEHFIMAMPPSLSPRHLLHYAEMSPPTFWRRSPEPDGRSFEQRSALAIATISNAGDPHHRGAVRQPEAHEPGR